MKTDPTFWIEARASGLAAYALVSLSVIAGLVLKSRPLGTMLRPAAVTDIHRFIALLAIVATALHGIVLVLDTSIEITVLALLIPGLVPYRPLWTGMGVVGAELMLVVYVSFSLRKLIGARAWRRLHWSTYALFATVTAHGLMSGTDSPRTWAIGLYLGAVGAVVFATCWRALVPPAKPSRRRSVEQSIA